MTPPRERLRQFRAVQSFYAPETRSHYVAGLTYTVRAGNVRLRGLAEQWAAQGRVAWLPEPGRGAGAAAVTGIGLVQDAPAPVTGPWWRRWFAWR